ncbi:Activator of 90 kDa heat shock protein ATPase -like protein 1 [Trichinella britovi]|uniref:Activator of 90 kDa heat shock protein ATPase-like protein 1 n=2 Tax=Trichinella TaxID=6333 RepID=A0A0V1DDB6_TRIBR|nr:Activator of 90 kDa heat shock protein ATPase -like protein 1 [Trichinella murrelli]KRY59584.1 Activator of 90 kDa heat shock protein ATPase -like protein 1 [Trichinella britovi]
MALWGQGDPRWIVEERPDATNVNNWHWTERNATPWSKRRFSELLENMKIDSERIECVIKSIATVEGEATANNRKGKLIFLFEWNIVLNWTGKLKDGNNEIEGTVEIPNLSDENSVDEISIEVTCKTSDAESDEVLSVMRSEGVPVIRKQLATYLDELRKEFGQKLILPTKDNTSPVVQYKETKSVSETSRIFQENKDRSANKNSGVLEATTSLDMKDTFKCTGDVLYTFFIHAPVLNQKIVMKWRMSTWPRDQFSIVTLLFEQKDDCSEIVLNQTGIPASQVENTEDGWKRHYFNAIKMVFGLGAPLI